MLQFYFLSILLNLITGCILLYSSEKPEILETRDGTDDFSGDKELSVEEDEKTENPGKSAGNVFKRIFGSSLIAEDSLFQLVIGITGVFTGVIKFLTAVDGPLFFGDFIPALACITGGLSLLLSYYNSKSDISFTLPGFLEKIFVDGRKIVGFACIIVAVIHFIIPGVLFV